MPPPLEEENPEKLMEVDTTNMAADAKDRMSPRYIVKLSPLEEKRYWQTLNNREIPRPADSVEKPSSSHHRRNLSNNSRCSVLKGIPDDT